MILHVQNVGPGVSVQDLGRPGWQAQGLSCGGAVDRLALFEGAALLGQTAPLAALEMMGFGGVFRVMGNTRIALTGAVMQATVDGAALQWNAVHHLRKGDRLQIGGAVNGTYGYVSFAGGIITEPVMGSRATHLTAGIGAILTEGDTLPLGPDEDNDVQMILSGGRQNIDIVRIMPGPQTMLFDEKTRKRFTQAVFIRSPRGNRQGVRLDHDGSGFTLAEPINLASDMILPGDVQMTGDGVPYVLLAECQTIGGYPRIGTVIPNDLPKVTQLMAGAELRFQFIDIEAATQLHMSEATQLTDLRNRCVPLVRDPHDIPDLLGYQLIDGVTPGDDLERP